MNLVGGHAVDWSRTPVPMKLRVEELQRRQCACESFVEPLACPALAVTADKTSGRSDGRRQDVTRLKDITHTSELLLTLLRLRHFMKRRGFQVAVKAVLKPSASAVGLNKTDADQCVKKMKLLRVPYVRVDSSGQKALREYGLSKKHM